MKKKEINIILILNIKSYSTIKNILLNLFIWIKKSPPPKNKLAKILDITKMKPYSLIKKKANKNPPYSTLYPAINSASASTKSKGILLVSANIQIIKQTPKGNKGKIYHIVSIWCKITKTVI